MTKTKINWLIKKKEGLYCIPGDFFIDPILPVEKALITHAHTDHARPNNKLILSSKETIDLMKLRYGRNYCLKSQTIKFNEVVKINNLKIRIYPAGHILGSVQFLIEYNGYRLLISGDYKRASDITCIDYEPVKCDSFITEATFGLPIFNHPNDKEEAQKLISSLINNKNSTHLIGVYALGKIKKVTETSQSELLNSIILCPPSSLNDKWSQKFKNTIKGYVSGWMAIRQRVKQRNIELPIIISDHVDWKGILKTVSDVAPSEVLVTHGREEALVYYLSKKNYRTSALNLIGFEDENE